MLRGNNFLPPTVLTAFWIQERTHLRVDKSDEKLVLIVDDQETDQHMLVRALRRLGVQNPVHSIYDGHDAIRYLNGDAPYGNRGQYPLPCIIFLDLHLPVVSGWDVLDWIHAVRLKGEAKIFIYSQIDDVAAIRKVYSLGADSFLRKPVDEMDLMNLIYHFPSPWELRAEGAEGKRSIPRE